MKVAVCFYGITRCLDKTLPEIERNLLGPLRSAGASCEIFLHCLTMDVLSNERSGEQGCEVDPGEWSLLCPSGPNALAEPQEDVDERLGHEHYQLQRDPWQDGYASMRNHVRALYSQGRVVELIPDPLSFDVIISARPDILYSNPFDPAWIQPKYRRPTLTIPEFGTFGGLNDRFAAGAPEVMIKYMLRGHDYKVLHLTSPPATHKKLTGEKFLAKWVKQHRVKVRQVPWTFARIRANGMIPERDQEYVDSEG